MALKGEGMYKVIAKGKKWTIRRPDGRETEEFDNWHDANRRAGLCNILFGQATADSTDSSQRSSSNQETEHE